MKLPSSLSVLGLLGSASFFLSAASFQSVPTDIQQPGTQPGELSELESATKCDNCHGGYDLDVEPAHLWRGSMMSQAVRDPLFWATVAIAEQDFPGSGDLCIRCHTPRGWLGGRSTPTDGSALKGPDAEGVQCDACHQMVDPSGLEHAGVQNAPFLANDEGAPPVGYYGGSMLVLAADSATKFGPYGDAAAPHSWEQSSLHRRSEFCASCHDVSNPAVGDLAPGNGAQVPLPPGTFSGVPGAPVTEKAAFRHFPYAYGAVERTTSEHASGLLATTRVADYPQLPAELQAGSLQDAYEAAVASSPLGDYADGSPRTFTCQTCHMPPTTGKGSNKPYSPLRTDIPHHGMTGGNTWVPLAIQYLDASGDLVIGGGLDAAANAALDAGVLRARANLHSAASLTVEGNVVRVVNLTGHKLITGYPEGRRMWLQVDWRDASGSPLREDGAYGDLVVQHAGGALVVQSLLDLDDPYTRVWEAQLGVTQAWAAKLVGLGQDPALALEYDRLTGAPTLTLDQLANAAPGVARVTFRFALNDRVVKDNRIPPYGYRYDDARERNALPVPQDLYGDPGAGGVYEHWDEVVLDPPAGAQTATVRLLYQTTSWEYVQFLALADEDTSAFLADTPDDLFTAWSNTGMSAPEVMAEATWAVFPDCNANGVDDLLEIAAGTSSDCNANAVPDECEGAQELVRLGSPPNPQALFPGATSGPTLGSTWDPFVDHTAFLPGAIADLYGLSFAPANIPLPGLGTLLCDPTAGLVTLQTAPSASLLLPLPMNCNLIGAQLVLQAASFDGLGAIGLTNALDATVGAP